jgi:cellulose synthase/poly-beta-1,6-N-acetylglucosamine synthase-like glycosyltransferase
MIWAEFLFWLSCFLICHTYLLYPLSLMVFSAYFARQRRKDEKLTPSVSMLIPAYNEASVIEQKIKNCRELDYPRDKLEILIGSDGSTDRTNELAQKNTEGMIRFNAFEQRRGKAAVLNDLARLARGEILVFSDANSMYRPDAIRRLVASFGADRVGGVCGRLALLNASGRSEAEGERLYWDYENYLKYLEGKIQTVFGANGAIYAIRRNLFGELSTQTIVIDDFVIPMRIVKMGYDVVYEKDAVAWEFTAPNVRSEFKRKVRIGAGNFHSIRDIVSLLNPLRGFIAFGLWSHKITRWLAPFLLIAAFAAAAQLRSEAFYKEFFFIQLIFYGVVIIAWVLDCLNFRVRWLVYPYYFVMANLALLIGFFKFLMGTQKPTWVRVER